MINLYQKCGYIKCSRTFKPYKNRKKFCCAKCARLSAKQQKDNPFLKYVCVLCKKKAQAIIEGNYVCGECYVKIRKGKIKLCSICRKNKVYEEGEEKYNACYKCLFNLSKIKSKVGKALKHPESFEKLTNEEEDFLNGQQ